MIRRFRILAAVLAVFVSAGTAVAQDKVRISHSTESFAFIPFFTAIAMDYFSKEGVDAEIVRTGSGSKTVAAVVGESADIAIGSTSSVLLARKAGIDLRIMSGLVSQYTSVLVYSKKWAQSHGVTEASSMKDKLAAMKGARIATSGPGGGDQIIRYIAALAKLDPDKDLTIQHMGNDTGVFVAATEADRIDGFAISAPAPQIAKRDLGAIIAFNTAVGEVKELDGYLYIVASARGNWLESNPDIAKKVVKVFQRALDALKDPKENLVARDAVHQKYYSDVPKRLFDDVWEEATQSASPSTKVSMAALTQVTEFVNQFQKNPKKQIDPADLPASFTNAYAQ
ncbi:MAG: ABC transporter substrate-binding protein [Burkholderiaceae bacterium]